jgi:hypothetical protein
VVVGGGVGAVRKRDAQRAQAADQNEFNRAFAACMTGRGYTVS